MQALLLTARSLHSHFAYTERNVYFAWVRLLLKLQKQHISAQRDICYSSTKGIFMSTVQNFKSIAVYFLIVWMFQLFIFCQMFFLFG